MEDILEHYKRNYSRDFCMRQNRRSDIVLKTVKDVLKLKKKNKTGSSRIYSKPVGFKKQVFRIIDKERTNAKSDMLPNSIDSARIGKHIFRDGDRPQRFRKTPFLFSLAKTKFSGVLDEDMDLDKNVVIEGAFYSNLHSLNESFTSQETCSSSVEDVQRMLKEISTVIPAVIRKLKIKTLPANNFMNCLISKFDRETYSGFIAEKYFNLRKKNQAYPISKILAKIRYNEIEKSSRLNKPLDPVKILPGVYTIGARNKRDYTYEEEETLKSRVVHMPDLHVEIVSAPWTDKICQFIKEEERGPLYIGNNYLKYERLYKDISKAKTILEGDWKRFDNSISVAQIMSAIAICRLYYPLNSKRVDKHFIAIFDSLVIKDYITPGGNLFRLLKTLPSGVKSTSLLGSIINLTALCYCVGEKDLKRTSFVVGGDDFLISSDIKLAEEDIENIKLRSCELGMTFKYIEEREFNSKESSKIPVFYKYSIFKQRPIISFSSLMERCLMPWNKRYNTDEELFKFLEDLMPGIGYPCTTNLLYYALYRDIYNRIYKGFKEMKIEDVFKIHCETYEKVISGKIILNKDRFEKMLVYDVMKNIKSPVELKEYLDVGRTVNLKVKFKKKEGNVLKV